MKAQSIFSVDDQISQIKLAVGILDHVATADESKTKSAVNLGRNSRLKRECIELLSETVIALENVMRCELEDKFEMMTPEPSPSGLSKHKPISRQSRSSRGGK